MAGEYSWSSSDTIASIALLVALASFAMQYFDRGMPYKVQTYIDKTQAAGKIIDAVEQVIHARQLAMISVDYNIYEPTWAKQMSVAQMNSDSKHAGPVVIALGAYKGTMQSNIRFYNEPKTLAALTALDQQVDLAVTCFTNLASASHQFNPTQTETFRTLIATSCAGANLPPSLDALKQAEGAAIAAMEAERTAGTKVSKPK